MSDRGFGIDRPARLHERRTMGAVGIAALLALAVVAPGWLATGASAQAPQAESAQPQPAPAGQQPAVVAPIKRVQPKTPPLAAEVAKSVKAGKQAKAPNGAKPATKAAKPASQPKLPKKAAATRCAVGRAFDPVQKKCIKTASPAQPARDAAAAKR